MPVTCPHCRTRYVLPGALLGPGGARVRCPRCREPFAVGPDGVAALPPPSTVASGSHAGNGTAVLIATAPAASLTAPDAVPMPGAASPTPAAPRIATSSPTPDPGLGTPGEIARAVLDELAAHSGEAIAASRAEGRLFREFGAVIAEAFEYYRRRVGSPADPAPFRAALRERWGVDLEPGNPPQRPS